MSTALRFDDHPAYHRSFLATTAGAALGGAIAGIFHLTSVPFVTGGLVGALAGLSWAERSRHPAVIGLRLCAAAAGLTAVMLGAGVWAVAIALGLGLAAGTPTLRRAAGVMIAGAAAGFCAAWAAKTIGHARETASLAPWIQSALAATAVGLAATLALAVRHVRLVADPVDAAYRALPPLGDEARDLVERGRTIWVTSAELSIPGDDNRDLVKDGVLKLFAVAGKLAQTRAVDGAEVNRRIGDIDQRIEACSDAVAREQYKDARAALVDQRRYVDRVGAARERIVARMHHCVATLEKFRLACAQLDAAAAAREAADARSAMSVLGELGDGLAIVGSGELPGLPPPAEAAPPAV